MPIPYTLKEIAKILHSVLRYKIFFIETNENHLAHIFLRLKHIPMPAYKKLENVNEQQRKAAKIMQRTLVVILPSVSRFSSTPYPIFITYSILNE